jgi:hypothetical protein
MDIYKFAILVCTSEDGRAYLICALTSLMCASLHFSPVVYVLPVSQATLDPLDERAMLFTV